MQKTSKILHMIMRWSLTIVSILALAVYSILLLNLGWNNGNAKALKGLNIFKFILIGQMAIFFLLYELKFIKMSNEKRKEVLCYCSDQTAGLARLEQLKVKAKSDIMFSALLGYTFNYILLFGASYFTNKYAFLFTFYNSATILQFAINAVILITPFYFWSHKEVALHFVDKKHILPRSYVA